MEVLFGKGMSFSAYPIKMMFIETQEVLLFPAQAMFVVPKRNFKKAHDRNLLKRRMREAYRLNKNILYDELRLKNKKINLAFIFTGKKEESFNDIQSSVLKQMNVVLKRLTP